MRKVLSVQLFTIFIGQEHTEPINITTGSYCWVCCWDLVLSDGYKKLVANNPISSLCLELESLPQTKIKLPLLCGSSTKRVGLLVCNMDKLHGQTWSFFLQEKFMYCKASGSVCQERHGSPSCNVRTLPADGSDTTLRFDSMDVHQEPCLWQGGSDVSLP